MDAPTPLTFRKREKFIDIKNIYHCPHACEKYMIGTAALHYLVEQGEK